MKAYQISIFATKGSKGTQELSCVTKAASKKAAKEIADSIILGSKGEYDSVRLQFIQKI